MENQYLTSRPDEIKELLATTRTIAVVGISDKSHRDSNSVSRYLISKGYTIFPVNPALQSVFGLAAFASLRDINQPVDLVSIFRRPEFVMDVVKSAIAVGAKGIWMQPGAHNHAAATQAVQAGLAVVADRCIRTDHRMLIG